MYHLREMLDVPLQTHLEYGGCSAQFMDEWDHLIDSSPFLKLLDGIAFISAKAIDSCLYSKTFQKYFGVLLHR